jgi:hypothetical protein
MKQVLTRLGDVLYWAGSAVATLFLIGIVILFGVWLINAGPDITLGQAFETSAMLAVFGFLSWISGRACKYVLAGT